MTRLKRQSRARRRGPKRTATSTAKKKLRPRRVTWAGESAVERERRPDGRGAEARRAAGGTISFNQYLPNQTQTYHTLKATSDGRPPVRAPRREAEEAAQGQAEREQQNMNCYCTGGKRASGRAGETRGGERQNRAPSHPCTITRRRGGAAGGLKREALKKKDLQSRVIIFFNASGPLQPSWPEACRRAGGETTGWEENKISEAVATDCRGSIGAPSAANA